MEENHDLLSAVLQQRNQALDACAQLQANLAVAQREIVELKKNQKPHSKTNAKKTD